MVDGAYYSHELSKLAEENDINLIPTGLVGPTVKSTFKKGVYTAPFETCEGCPNFSNCPLKSQKKRYFFQVTQTKLERSKLMVKMKTDEYKKIASKRAGVEGIPSVLRRRYKIDHFPIRGLVRSKIYLGFKISAINCKRLINSS